MQTHNSLEKFKRANSGYMLCDIQGSKNPYYHAITTEGNCKYIDFVKLKLIIITRTIFVSN